MSDTKFDFSGDAVAENYDSVLVPTLFTPWAEDLLKEHGPWDGVTVLDLAAGTGVVSRLLSERVGPAGKVLAADLNPSMLAVARKRCQGSPNAVEFHECSADKMPLPDAAADRVLCQQGFQFFPDKAAAAKEIHRVLKPGGRAGLTAWLPVSDCGLFGAICESLEEVGEVEISKMMRIPFDHLSADEFRAPFEAAGFQDVRVEQKELPLRLKGGLESVGDFAYATPIGPSVKALPEESRQAFHKAFDRRAAALSPDGQTVGKMVTHSLSALRAA